VKRKRKTKIVATLGPACSDPAVLRAVLEAGVDVARFNMSHGSHQEHAERMGLVRSLSGELDREVAVLVDLQGPKIRTGRLKGGGPVELVEGATVTVRPGDFEGDAATIATAYEPLPDEVEPGDRILMDDGLLELRVQSVAGRDVACTVVEGGPLKERKGINLPGVHIKSPAVTAQDAADIPFAVEMDADYVALSFVQEAEDMRNLRELVAGVEDPPRLIAKLERERSTGRGGGMRKAARRALRKLGVNPREY